MEPNTPFAPTSGLAPQLIDALLVDADQVIAFAGDHLHRYDRSAQEWIDHGVVACNE